MKIYSKVVFILLFITTQLLSYDTKSLPINLPQSNVKLMVEKKVSLIDSKFLKASYIDGKDRGEVYAQIDKNLIDLSQTTSALYFTRVLYISNQGSANLAYIGLFKEDKITKKVLHIDSYLLASKIKEISVKEKNEILHITYLQHSSTQAMLEYPSELVKLYLYVEKDRLVACNSHPKISRFVNNLYQEDVGFRLVEGVNYHVDSFSDSKRRYYFIYFLSNTHYFCGTGGCSGDLVIEKDGELQIIQEFSLLRPPFYAIKDIKKDIFKEIITPVSFIDVDRWDTYYNVYNISNTKTKKSIYPKDKRHQNIKKTINNPTISRVLFDDIDALKPCPNTTIGIFDKLVSHIKLSKKFRKILIEFNDELVKKQYHKAIGKFDSTYYFNQLSLLSEHNNLKPMDMKAITKKFIKEAMHFDTKNVIFEIDNIKALQYIGTFSQNDSGKTMYLMFEIILKDGRAIKAGYLYHSDDFSFFGSDG